MNAITQQIPVIPCQSDGLSGDTPQWSFGANIAAPITTMAGSQTPMAKSDTAPRIAARQPHHSGQPVTSSPAASAAVPAT
jgi:hypothetical protein